MSKLRNGYNACGSLLTQSMFIRRVLFSMLIVLLAVNSGVTQYTASGSVPKSVTAKESDQIRMRALDFISDYYTSFSLLVRSSSDQKTMLSEKLISKYFENPNVLVLNDFDPAIKAQSKQDIGSYLDQISNFSSKVKADVRISKIRLSPLLWSEEFIFLKAEFTRAMSVISNLRETVTDSLKVDVYLRLESDQTLRIHRIKEHHDNLKDFIPLEISDAPRVDPNVVDPLVGIMRFQLVPLTVLDVASQPVRARVFLNNQEVRNLTPTRLELLQRTHQISIRSGNYLPFDTTLNLEGLKTLSLRKRLVPAWADLQVSSDQRNTQFFINGQLEGVGTLLRSGPVNGFSPGRVRIEARAEKFRTLVKEIDLKAGLRENVEFNLTPTMGKLIVETTPSGADVRIDGQSIGKTPFSQELLAADYDLVVALDNYKTVREKVAIRDLQDTRVGRELVSFSSVSKSLRFKRAFAYTIGMASLSAGVYLMRSADINYKAYQTAGTNAASLREKVQFADKFSPVSFAVGGVAMLSGFIFSGKVAKLRKTWDLAAAPSRDGAVVVFLQKF